ncbi:MGDG synthase family glycosyltransferase [Paenibacillus sp. BAC0078]
MNWNPVVLIVTSKFGDGHVKVAEAIEHSFKVRGMDRVYTVDLFAEVNPRLNELSRRFYLNSTFPAQELYGLLYEITSSMKPGRAMGKLLHSLGKRKVRQLLEGLRPDVIIHTFPYLAAAQLAEETDSQVPVFTVMTDYVLHGRWMHPHTTKYFVASERLKTALLAAGAAEDTLVVSGIPVRHPFEQVQDREELLAKHGLDGTRRYLLLAAGAYGVLSNISGLIHSVLAQSGFDVIVVCGNNHKLRAATESIFKANDRVHVLGYTDRMHELMHISSCLLTKAGGITLTEALSQLLPVIVYRPLPGQEAGNAAALASEQIIDVALDEEQLISQLHQLEDPEYREQRKQFMREFARKASAERIVTEALEVIEQRQPFAEQAAQQLLEGQVQTIHGYL